MTSSKRSFRRFNVRSNCGQIAPPAPRFTSGLLRRDGESHAPVDDDAVIAAALRILSQRLAADPAFTGPGMVREYLAVRFAGLEHEVFACLFLDNRHRILAFEELFRGTIDGTAVYPREVIKRALAHNAAAVILAHNHPSGVAEPSRTDEVLTQRLREALEVVGIRVLDHLVTAGASVVSFAERGLL